MMLSADKAFLVFKKVKMIREEYRAYILGGDTNRISVTDLQHIVEQMYGLTIVKTQVPFEGEFVRGLMERYDDKIVIRVKLDQSDDYKRFTTIKEMCHAIIDEKEDWSAFGVDTITNLLNEYSLEDGAESDSVIQSEAFAEIAASELMYPFECREYDREKLEAKTTTIVKIASYHGMPVKMVSTVLTDDYHLELATPLWQQVQSEG